MCSTRSVATQGVPLFVQIAGDNLKRRASLTGQQQRAVVFGGRFNTAVHFLNDGTVAQFVQSHAGGRLNFAMFQGAFYRRQEFLQGNRFSRKSSAPILVASTAVSMLA